MSLQKPENLAEAALANKLAEEMSEALQTTINMAEQPLAFIFLDHEAERLSDKYNISLEEIREAISKVLAILTLASMKPDGKEIIEELAEESREVIEEIEKGLSN